ncbi:hypothetical protein ACH3XW_2330 [Acanthocheilonema viteae]
MLIYRYINTPAGEFKSEKIIEMSSDYLRDQAFFLHREEQLTYHDPILMGLYGYRDNFCFPTSSYIYLFNSILTFSPDKYNESHIPLISTSRYPITFTTETYCYTQPLLSTLQFDQQSLDEFVPVTFPPPPPSSPSNPAHIFRQAVQSKIDIENLIETCAKMLTRTNKQES